MLVVQLKRCFNCSVPATFLYMSNLIVISKQFLVHFLKPVDK